MNIQYVKGDATQPQGDGLKMIIHIVNDVNAWGSGFVLAISRRWPIAEKSYHSWFALTGEEHASIKPVLGMIQLVNVERDVLVVNMVAQHGVGRDHDGHPPIRYTSLRECLDKVCNWALYQRKEGIQVSVHGPRFGAGLSGGDWDTVAYLIDDTLIKSGIPVTIYDLP